MARIRTTGLQVVFIALIGCGSGEVAPPFSPDGLAAVASTEQDPADAVSDGEPTRECERQALAFLDFDSPHRSDRLIVAPRGGTVAAMAAQEIPGLFPKVSDLTRSSFDDFSDLLEEAFGAENLKRFAFAIDPDPFAGTDAAVVTLRPADSSLEQGTLSSRELALIAKEIVCAQKASVVELDYLIFPHADPPDDPIFVNDDQWNLKHVEIPIVWEDHTGSGSVKIAVIDTGIDERHEEFAGRLDPGRDFIDGDTEPRDERGHGTLVAGIIAATANNALGLAGIDWAAKIVPVRIFGLTESQVHWKNKDLMRRGKPPTEKYVKSSQQTAAQAINWARTSGNANIMNLSFGFSAAASVMLKAALCNASSGVLFVASAGSGPVDIESSPVYPASWSCDNLITVTSVDWYDDLHGTANYGSGSVQIAAPGRTIPSANYCEDDDLADTDNDGTPDTCQRYSTLSGTSAAAPHVTGVAGLLLAKKLAGGATNVPPADLISALKDGADEVGTLLGLVEGSRRLNAAGAISSL